jgi:DNA-binding CsgD family transcriptional regulator
VGQSRTEHLPGPQPVPAFVGREPDPGDEAVEVVRAMTYLGFPYNWRWPVSAHLDRLSRAAALIPTIPSTVDRLALTADRAAALLLLGEPAGWDVAADWDASADAPAIRSMAAGRHQVSRGNVSISRAAVLWGRYAEASRRQAIALELAGDGQLPQVRRATLAAQVRLDWLAGRWTGLAERIAQLHNPGDERSADHIDVTEIVDARLGAAAGTRDDAEQRLASIRDRARVRALLDVWLEAAAALAHVRWAAGRVDGLLDVTDEPVWTVSAKGIWLWATDLAPARVAALTAAGRVDEAARFVAAFARGLRGRDAPAPRAALATCRALLATARLGPARATASAFGRAAAAWDKLPRPYDSCLARERQALCLIEINQTPAGLHLLTAAFRGFAELGARTDADRVAVSLAAHGAQPRRSWRSGRRGRRGSGGELSPRELEVVRLVAAGHTNREIAAALSRSPHTVGKQLHAAMRKLGVNSRTTLAVAAALIAAPSDSR